MPHKQHGFVPCAVVDEGFILCMQLQWCYFQSYNVVVGPRPADRGYGLQILKVATNMSNNQSRMADSGRPSSLDVGLGLADYHRKHLARFEILQGASGLDGLNYLSYALSRFI